MLFHHRQYINSCCTCCHTFSSLIQDLELISTKLFLEALSVSAHNICFGNWTRAQLTLTEPKNRKKGKQQKTFSNYVFRFFVFVYYLSIFYILTLLWIVKDLWRMYNVYTVHLHYDNKRKKNRPWMFRFVEFSLLSLASASWIPAALWHTRSLARGRWFMFTAAGGRRLCSVYKHWSVLSCWHFLLLSPSGKSPEKTK